MILSDNLKVKLYDRENDKQAKFIDFRTDVAGTGESSALQIIDKKFGDVDDQIKELQDRMSICEVNATFISHDSTQNVDYYEAVSPDITEYVDQTIVLLRLSQTNTGRVTIKINDLDTIEVKKTDPDGILTPMNGSNLKINTGYLIQYNTSNWVLIGEATSNGIPVLHGTPEDPDIMVWVDMDEETPPNLGISKETLDEAKKYTQDYAMSKISASEKNVVVAGENGQVTDSGIGIEHVAVNKYEDFSGEKSYVIQSHAGCMARPSANGYIKVDGTPSPDAPATISGAQLIITNGTDTKNLGVELCSLPNGAQDSFDGIKIIHKCNYIVLDGTENWDLNKLTNGYGKFFLWGNKFLPNNDANGAYLCTHFPALHEENPWPVWSNPTYPYLATGVTGERSLVIVAEFTTVETFKAYLMAQKTAGTPVTIYYEMIEPVISYINMDLPLVDGQNIITCTDAVLPDFTVTVINGPNKTVPYATDSQLLAGSPPSTYIQPQDNLLVNADFYNSINSKGQTTYSGGINETIDKWVLYEAGNTLTVGDHKLIVSGTLVQRFAAGYLRPGQTYTMSAKIKGSGIFDIFSYIAGDFSTEEFASTDWAVHSFIFTVPLGTDAQGMHGGFIGNYEIEWAKLEVGDHFTGFYPVNPETNKLQTLSSSTELALLNGWTGRIICTTVGKSMQFVGRIRNLSGFTTDNVIAYLPMKSSYDGFITGHGERGAVHQLYCNEVSLLIAGGFVAYPENAEIAINFSLPIK